MNLKRGQSPYIICFALFFACNQVYFPVNGKLVTTIVTSGHCPKGSEITSKSACAAAARIMGLSDTTVSQTDGSDEYHAPFCSYDDFYGNEWQSLRLNAGGGNTGECSPGKKCLCQTGCDEIDNCATCTGSDNSQCEICDYGYYLAETKNKCLKCPEGMVCDGLTKQPAPTIVTTSTTTTTNFFDGVKKRENDDDSTEKENDVMVVVLTIIAFSFVVVPAVGVTIYLCYKGHCKCSGSSSGGRAGPQTLPTHMPKKTQAKKQSKKHKTKGKNKGKKKAKKKHKKEGSSSSSSSSDSSSDEDKNGDMHV